MPHELCCKIFVSFCGGDNIFKECALVIAKKVLAAFFSRVYNLNMFCVYQILPHCHSQATLHQGDYEH